MDLEERGGDESDEFSNHPIQELETSLSNDAEYARLQWGRKGLDALRNATATASLEEVASVLERYTTATPSFDERVKCEILDYIPHMARTLGEGHNPNLKAFVYSHLWPVVTKSLVDPNIKVMKTGEAAFLDLVEHLYITPELIEIKIWPLLKSRMNHMQNVDAASGAVVAFILFLLQWFVGDHQSGCELCLFHITASFDERWQTSKQHQFFLNLMSRIAPWVGVELTERLFVPALERMCRDHEFAVRQVCASHFGDICAVVNPDVIETVLIPCFLRLCKDPQWIVRQSCAEVFTTVSCTVSKATRKKLLGPAFAKLLKAPESGVHFAAFLSLGPFITTFADPSVNILGYNHMGELVLKHPDGFEFKLNSTRVFRIVPVSDDRSLEEIYANSNLFGKFDEESFWNDDDTETETETETYNQFQYWREPLPNIDNDLNPNDNNNSPNPNVKIELQDLDRQDMNTSPVPSIDNDSDDDIVPTDLIKQFASMHSKDHELPHHCAYYLPAVALTAGAKNWKYLKPAYETLARDKQWKVRKIVASSIHELAVLIGEESASSDLVPVFHEFIKDLDEVRIAVLKHLAPFLKLLGDEERDSFLPELKEFLNTDYQWNWRFRQELAEQLLQVIGLFTPAQTCTHLAPVVIALLLDRVAEVRKIALQVVTELVSHVSIDIGLLRSLLGEIAEQFAHSGKWVRRQTFVLFCSRLITKDVLSGEMFARDVMPHLIDLSWDKVPNVRLAVARTLANDITTQAFFADWSNPYYDVLITVMRKLYLDPDQDVKFYANQAPVEFLGSNIKERI